MSAPAGAVFYFIIRLPSGEAQLLDTFGLAHTAGDLSATCAHLAAQVAGRCGADDPRAAAWLAAYQQEIAWRAALARLLRALTVAPNPPAETAA